MKKLEQRVPNLRFKGFTDDWEQRKLGDLFVYNRPDKYMVQDTNYIDSGTPVLTANKSFVLGYTNENHTYNKLPAIIFDDFTLENKFVKFPFMVKSSAIKILNSRNDQPMMFMYQLLQHSRFVHEGHSRHYISIVQRKDVMVPDNVEEQKKIATLFSRIQNIITLQQRKLALLKQLKKGLLQKMFADKDSKQPVLRFKGFHDDWEQRKLGELGSVQMNKRIFKNQTSESGDVPFYKIGTFGKKADAYISNSLYQDYKEKYPYPNKGDLLISASGSIGRIVEYKGQKAYYQDSNIVWLEHNNHVLNSFLKAFYQIVKWDGTEGSTIKRLYNKNILNTKIKLPKVKEQKVLGTLISTVDLLISLQQQKLAKYQSIKKSLLQQMFI